MEIISGHGSNEINLGSDYRAVKSTLKIQALLRKRVRFALTLKIWKLVIGGSGRAENSEAALMVKMESGVISGVEDMEKVLYEAGTTSGVQVQVQEKCKPWQSDAIQALIQERKKWNPSGERRRISKLIQKSQESFCGNMETKNNRYFKRAR